jgi:ATP-binding cassette subfamily C protein/ATP-binding cassette subfamily C protein EexD
VKDLLHNAPQRDEGMVLPAPAGRVDVAGANFCVPGSMRMILSGVTFSLAPGESLGIIGPSGSGKSTLARLLVGAWPCLAGAVRLDGANVYNWSRAELSRYIGYLPQDVEIFACTVRQNIARLNEGDPEKVVAAATLAGAHEMILSLAGGYDTELGESGEKLSGGQRQRIGIARALYGEPRFVVLDEPNSNLDAAGEQALQATVLELKKRGVTFVIVSHRPMTLAVVDKILILRDGVVEAFGPRAEILPRLGARAMAQRPNPTPAHARVVPLSQSVSAGGGQPDRAGKDA